MRKILALILCTLLLIPCLTSCIGIRPNAKDKGAEIPVHLTTEIYNLDPAYAYLDDAGAKILSLIYEGLFTLNSDGKAVKALCKDYKTYTNRDGEFVAEFTLKQTKWSDGRSINANDFVYAWKRIMEPEFNSKAASLLFDVKNARACKNGDISIDDFGVVASETRVLQVTFTHKIDINEFIKTLASPALVPLREDKANRLDDWASYYATMVTNGPFYVKTFIPGEGEMVLERSIYYYRDIESETQALDKYVKPYRINITMGDTEDAMLSYGEGNLVFNSQIPLSARASINATKLDTLSTATYVFNSQRAPFDNADVRRGLSLAIDRAELASIITYAKAAEGFIPNRITDKTGSDSFRENGGALISATADMAEAKKLVSAAEDKEISITIRDNEVDRAVAEYVKGQWEQLGFTVEIVAVTFEHYTNIEYDQYRDLLYTAYSTRDFDVIAIDSQMLSTDAFNELASYAKPFSGGAMDLASGNFDAVTNLSGYSSEEYDALIEEAFAAEDKATRSELLHKAEEMLVRDMPAAPLFVYENAYVKNKDLSKLTTDYFGSVLFDGAKLANYSRFKPVEENAE
ncbi:MAG: peptide ABC transporter substrate-binding protein [Clostridia bacterium]|nr:peptide ABC transporter substrate-binding protein [Clostridia bacterium]